MTTDRELDELLQRGSDSALRTLSEALDPEDALARFHERRARDELLARYRESLSAEDRWSHCGSRSKHSSHPHTVTTNEGSTPTRCVGVPDLEEWAAGRAEPGDTAESAEPNPFVNEGSGGWTRGPSEPGEYDEQYEQYLRALRPGSQPLPTPSDREGAHDALLREHLREAVEGRKLLGLSRYHTLLQAGNGRDSLCDAVEEVLDLAAYLQVWQQGRDEALELLSELRAAVAVYHEDNVVLDIAAYAQPADLIAKIRRIEHLLGGGTT